MAADDSRSISGSTNASVAPKEPKLHRVLNGWQIFFIVITVVIGSGCFTDYGVVAKTAGPPGLLIAVVVVGVVAICAMEGLAEMIQLFPIVNPIVELVYHFVDQDLALWVGIAYWLAYACFLPLQIIRAASYLDFYTGTVVEGLGFKIPVFFVIIPIFIVLINCVNVKAFGFIESFGGGVKMIILIIVVFMLYEIAGAADTAKHFGSGLTSTLRGSEVHGSAICLAIESVAFSFLGIESIALTAFEAKSRAALRIPSKFMAYVAFLSYFIYAIPASFCLDWNETGEIPDLVGQYFVFQSISESGNQSQSTSVISIAALKVGKVSLADAMNVMLIFCAVSAANSTLYMSSRMLYGLAYSNKYREKPWINWLATVGKNGVPRHAVWVSAGMFSLWLPYPHIKSLNADTQFLSWFFAGGNVCIFFMWGSVSLAYIRYWFAFYRHRNKDFLQERRFRKFRSARSKDRGRGFSTFLDWLQPIPAVIGLLGSIGIVWVFSTAIFWGRSFTARQFIQNYSLPIFLPLLFTGWKIVASCWRVRGEQHKFKSLIESFGEWWHKFDDEDKLKVTINKLLEYRDPENMSDEELPRWNSSPIGMTSQS